MLINGIVHMIHTQHTVFEIKITNLITGLFAAGACLISFGACLGKLTHTQCFSLVLFEVIFFAINEFICVEEFQIVDMGGSIIVHTFGA